jgi:hypothetical protein
MTSARTVGSADALEFPGTVIIERLQTIIWHQSMVSQRASEDKVLARTEVWMICGMRTTGAHRLFASARVRRLRSSVKGTLPCR